MGKQINFYLFKEDIEKLEEQLRLFPYQIVWSASEKEEMFALDLFEKSPYNSAKKLLALASQESLIRRDYLKERALFFVDEFASPVIEFLGGGLQDGQLRRGRLFFETGYFDESSVWIQKNEDFLKAADKLFRWFKKTFKKVDEEPFRGAYTSESVIEWVRQGGKIAVN